MKQTAVGRVLLCLLAMPWGVPSARLLGGRRLTSAGSSRRLSVNIILPASQPGVS